ncbi:GNAT family N-acetyltransferase [Kibdelosporangium lantanae]|uniref:GNAT family N-acetyltransferase n=1 Tax=Kibdelosporangium lantanae TaxID=1497396 RepID=A0ABW3MBX8_9PSEU
MEARVHDDPETFRPLAMPLLAADPVRNTVLLTAAESLSADSVMITLHDGDDVVGLVTQVLPYPLVVTAMPIEAAELVARTVHGVRPQLTGSSGVVAHVEAFNAAWTELTGATATMQFGSRLFRLGELVPPKVDGRARQAAEVDLPLVTKWRDAFMAETFPEEAEAQAKRRPDSDGVIILWEVDGQPVSYAGARGPYAGMVRVAPVYTPEELRGHGYASAATAAVSQWALDQGAEHVLLFTDVANPTPNRLYPRLGYEPLDDSVEYKFSN